MKMNLKLQHLILDMLDSSRIQDFFMDGGKEYGSSSKEQTETNLKNMLSFLQNENSDFALLQEVDIKSMRSFDVMGMNF